MGVNASRVKQIVDKASQATLRDVASGAITSTTTETALSLNELRAAYWQNYEIPHGVFAVSVNVTALDLSSGDETYTVSLLVDDVSGMNNNPVAVDSFPVKVAGVYTRYINSMDIPNLDADHDGLGKWIAVKATLAGTTPSFTYGAWLGPVHNI